MAYDSDSDFSDSSSKLVDIITSQGRAAGGGAIDEFIKSAGIKLNRTQRYEDSVYSGGSGFERVRFNREQKLTEAQIAENSSLLAGKTYNRAYSKDTQNKIQFTNTITEDSSGKILASETERLKTDKPSFLEQLFVGAVTTGLSAAFGGALGFGPLAAGGSGSFGSSAFGKAIGTIGRGAVQGGVQSGISALIQGKDPLKAGITGAFSGGISSSLTPIFGTSALGRAATSGITSGVTAAATGGDPLSASLLGIVGQTGGVLGLDGSTAQFVNNLARITTQVELAKRKQKGG